MNYKYNLKDHKIKHLGQNLLLHPLKSIFWEEQNILFISDLHIGKAAHFRRSGIPIPEEVHDDDFSRMRHLIQQYKPKRLIFLGDLFHSSYNNAWEDFKSFVSSEISIRPELVVGNHDILEKSQYSFLDIHEETLIIEPYILSHEPLDKELISNYYNLCGHLHPSVRIKVPPRQNIRVECFYFGKKHGILPAFGNFTGSSKLPKRSEKDCIFAITENDIIPLHQKL